MNGRLDNGTSLDSDAELLDKECPLCGEGIDVDKPFCGWEASAWSSICQHLRGKKNRITW